MTVDKERPMGTPIQATVGPDRFPLVGIPVIDPRNAAAEILAAYLRQVIFRIDGGLAESKEFRLNDVLANWPEVEEALDYPSASIDDGVSNYEPHNFTPTMCEETLDCFGKGTVLWKTSELVVDFQVDYWTNTEADRQAISAGLPRIFNPTEIRSGVLLSGHPQYFYRPARFTLMDVDRIDTAESTYDRERRLKTVVRSEIDTVHLREVTQLRPTVVSEVQE